MTNVNEPELVKSLFEQLLTKKIYQFPKEREQLHAPLEKGVYIIRSKDGRVLHVGRTPRAQGGIKQRLYDHLYGRSSFTHNYLNGNGCQLRQKECTYQCIVIKDSRVRAFVEAYAIGHLCPKHVGEG